MTDTGPAAGWGIAASLPPAIQRRMIAADAEEHRVEREQAAEREIQAEQRHQRALALAAQQAEGHGEYVSALALATGQVPGRTFAQIFAAADAAGDREDQIAAARANREGRLTHVEFGEPVILSPAARSDAGWKIFQRARKFKALVDARVALEQAERDAEASKNDFGFVCERRSRKDDDPVVAVPLSSRDGDLAGYRVSYR